MQKNLQAYSFPQCFERVKNSAILYMVQRLEQIFQLNNAHLDSRVTDNRIRSTYENSNNI